MNWLKRYRCLGLMAALPLVSLLDRLRLEPCAVYADVRRGPHFARIGPDRLA